MAQQEIEGFNKLFIHDIPYRVVFNKDNINQFPLKECSTWISNDENWQLDMASDVDYRVTPFKSKAINLFHQHYPFIKGTLEYCLKQVKKLQQHVNETHK